MSEAKITPYTVSEGKVAALKVEDSIGSEVIETEQFDIEYMSTIAPAIVALAHRKRQLAVFKQSYEEGLVLFTEAEANLKQAIQQANRVHVNPSASAPAHTEQPKPQEHEEGCGCSKCAEKHRQEFEQQILKKEKPPESRIEIEAKATHLEQKEENPSEKNEGESLLQQGDADLKLKQPTKIPEPPVEKTAEQWSEEIYEKLMQDLHTNFKGKTLKREEITQKLTGEYGVPDAFVQEVMSIIHERARKEKKISEPKGEGIFGSIAKRLRKAQK